MYCQNCPKKKTCTQICPELEAHLKKDEVYMREMLVSPEKLEWIANQIYTGEWHMRHPEYREKLKKCLNELPEEAKILMEMKFDQGKSYREVGERYKLTKSQMRYRIKKILQKLGREIE